MRRKFDDMNLDSGVIEDVPFDDEEQKNCFLIM